MFEEFENTFSRDPREGIVDSGEVFLPSFVGLQELLRSFGGFSFSGGLYRIVEPKELDVWKLRVTYAFPQFEGRIVCFGYDWLGSVFALDSGRPVGAQPGVTMFEPGTGKALQIPCNLLSFHNKELKDSGEAALAISFFQKWVNNGGKRPLTAECVGYKRPLFLGGIDEVENLEISDIDVYWHLMGQLIRKARGLPTGTIINKVTID